MNENDFCFIFVSRNLCGLFAKKSKKKNERKRRKVMYILSLVKRGGSREIVRLSKN